MDDSESFYHDKEDYRNIIELNSDSMDDSESFYHDKEDCRNIIELNPDSKDDCYDHNGGNVEDTKVNNSLYNNKANNHLIESRETAKTSKTPKFLCKKVKRPKHKKEKKKLGRRGNSSHYNIYGKDFHSKSRKDNIMRKIKPAIYKYIHKKLNNSVPKKFKFLRIIPVINQNLKIDYNQTLWKTKIWEIYANNPISTKYQNNKNYQQLKKKNRENIDYIFSNQDKGQSAYDILNSTYGQMADDFAKNGLSDFKNVLEIKEKDNENNGEYIEKVINLTKNMNSWIGERIPKKK